ncbi:hypothetical protein MMC22_007211 [Lobaria immixta]|nr:hypothetical protein [Lobaria immixta]
MTFYAMKTSWSFLMWRGLLNKYNVDISGFVNGKVLVCSTDAHRRWNAQTFMALFEYKFKPVYEYGIERSHPMQLLLTSRLKELRWCKNVEKIERGLHPDRQPKKIFWAESEESFEGYSARVVNEEMMNNAPLDPHFGNPYAVDPDHSLDFPPSESLLEDEDQGFQRWFIDNNGPDKLDEAEETKEGHKKGKHGTQHKCKEAQEGGQEESLEKDLKVEIKDRLDETEAVKRRAQDGKDAQGDRET